MSSSSDMLVRRCTSFVFNLMKTDLDQWMQKNCHHFDQADEMKLIYTQLYTEFSEVVEEKMKEFVKDEGYSSMRGLAKDMRDAVINSDRSSLYLNTLLAALDFEKFVKLMIQKAARKREEAKLDEEEDDDGEESDNSNNSDTSTRHVNNKDINNYEGKHK